MPHPVDAERNDISPGFGHPLMTQPPTMSLFTVDLLRVSDYHLIFTPNLKSSRPSNQELCSLGIHARLLGLGARFLVDVSMVTPP